MEPTQRAGGEGSGSASPPNPVRALVHPGVGRTRDQATAPGGEVWKRVLPHLGQRRFLPNWIPFCLLLPSAIMLLSLDTCCCIYQGAKTGLAQGQATHDKLSLTVAKGCLTRLPPGAPDPWPCTPAPSSPLHSLHFGLLTLPVPGPQRGLWAPPLAWMPQLPGSTGKEKLPRAPEASRCFEQAGL